MRAIELFAGCGGLALGLARAGFSHEMVVDFDRDAVATLMDNKHRRVALVDDWQIAQYDLREFDYSEIGEV